MTRPNPTTRRWWAIGSTAAVGAGLLGAGMSAPSDSARFYALTAATAGTWVIGGLACGLRAPEGSPAVAPATAGAPADGTGPDGAAHAGPTVPALPTGRPWTGRTGPLAAAASVAGPVALGATAYAAFHLAARIARRVPVLDRAVRSVLRHAEHGTDRPVLLTTLVNGVAEEVFFRGAVHAAATGTRRPVVTTTAFYALTTAAGTRNPALVAASVVMGALFGAQRQATGGLRAPVLTHLTWSWLMLRRLPRLYRDLRSGVPAAHPDPGPITAPAARPG